MGEDYLPCLLAAESLDADLRDYVWRCTGLVLRALKQLYIKHGPLNFTIGNVLVEAVAMDPCVVDSDIKVGMWMARDFSGFTSGWSGSPGGDVASVGLLDDILDYESLEGAWQEELNRRKRIAESRLIRVQPAYVSTEGSPLVAANAIDFAFVSDSKLRGIVERDYSELQNLKSVSATKSRLIISGGLIEALLLDALRREEANARAAKKAEDRPLDEWKLSTLIDVSVELQLISAGAQSFGHSVREFRNLVHPGREIKSSSKVALEEAEIAEKVLEIVIRDLREKGL